MKSIKPIELVNLINGWINETKERTSDGDKGGTIINTNFRLEEELWGLKPWVYSPISGVRDSGYYPIGKLQLPISIEYDDVGFHGGYLVTIWSNFCGAELDSPVEISKKYLGDDSGTLEESIYPVSDERVVIDGSHTLTWELQAKSMKCLVSQEKNPNAYEMVMKYYIPLFLTVYDASKKLPTTTEALRNLRGSFIDYRGVESELSTEEADT